MPNMMQSNTGAAAGIFPKQNNVFILEKYPRGKPMSLDNAHSGGKHTNMDELSTGRLWKHLDNMGNKLSGIQGQLADLVRLQEKVNSHSETLNRFGKKLEDHDARQRSLELWQAERKDLGYGDVMITRVQEKLDNISDTIGQIHTKTESMEKRIDVLEQKNGVSKGQKDVVKEILKWVAGILSALLVYLITKSGNGGA